MSGSIKNEKKENQTNTDLDFSASDFDMEMEKLGTTVTANPIEEESNGFDLVFDVDSDAGDLAMESSTTSSQVINSDQDLSEGLSFTTEPESQVTDNFGLDEATQDELNLPEDLASDIASFEGTRTKFEIPKLVTPTIDDIEFDMGGVPDAAEVVEFAVPEKAVVKPVEIQRSESDYSLGDIQIETKKEEVKPIIELAPKAPSEPIMKPAPIPVSHHQDFKMDLELQTTIRQMRDEREDLLKQIKDSKNIVRDLEQDNLTLKSELEETKIEVSILRKRQTTELEELKYRLAMSEDKKTLAEEKMKSLNVQKEKLEQKVRIDLNQVKQREKELETKLEMLSMDVDSQVQTRDQKILELRRKIDSLEFNMENVSIREQKTTEDKRKIEDKLNKIMKTLRNSIKNLEDEVEPEQQSNRENTAGKSK